MDERNNTTEKAQRAGQWRSRVLICSLGAGFDELFQADTRSYLRFYRPSEARQFTRIKDLLTSIALGGYEIVHLLTNVSGTGMLMDAGGETIKGELLVQKCLDSGVRLLWIASDNRVDAYIKGFKARPINLVMTIDRKGSAFSIFLEQLLCRMAGGQPMALAWVELSPQDARAARHMDLPVTIFAAANN